MSGFHAWLLLTESGRLDTRGFNALFRAHLDDLLPRVTDPRRRTALEEMRDFDWIGYVLTSLRNAGFADRQEREEAAHDLTAYLLVQPGQLFAGYDPTASGPMPARFAIAVGNAIRNLRRGRARRDRFRPVLDTDALAAVPDREPAHAEDGELVAALRWHLVAHLGERAGRLLDLRLAGLTYQQINRHARFDRLSRWGLRNLAREVRGAARDFARDTGDEAFLARVERLLAGRTPDAGRDD